MLQAPWTTEGLESRIRKLPDQVPIPDNDLESEDFYGDPDLIDDDEDIGEHYSAELMIERLQGLEQDAWYLTLSQAATMVLGIASVVYRERGKNDISLISAMTGVANWSRDQIDYGLLVQNINSLEGDVKNAETYCRKAGYGLTHLKLDE